MTRRVFPQDRTVYVPSGGLMRTARVGAAVDLYVDADPTGPPAAVTPADYRRADGTPGPILVDSNSQMAEWQGSDDNADTMIVRVDGGPPWRVYARQDDRLDNLDGRVTALEPGGISAAQPADPTLTAFAGLTPTDGDVLQHTAGSWANRTPTQVKTTLGLVKSDVGLGSVDNTADLTKPVSAATQTALDGKAAASHSHSETDITGLTSDLAGRLAVSANLSDLGSTATARTNLGLGTAATSNTGTGAANTILGNDPRLGDARTPTSHAGSHQPGGSDPLAVDAAAATGSLRTLGTGSAQAAAGNDPRLSDARVPTVHKTSHATGGGDALTAGDIGAVPATRSILAGSGLAGGGPLTADVTLTAAVQTVAGRTGTVVLAKADVGLGNVDNTADTAKPVSSAQQTALDGKLAKASNLTDVASVPTARSALNINRINASRRIHAGTWVAGEVNNFVNGQYTSQAADFAASTARTRFVATADFGDIVCVYGNWNGDETTTAQTATFTIAAVLEIGGGSTSGTLYPLTIGGAATATIAPGQIVRTDPFPITILKGGAFYIRTYVQMAAQGDKWPQGRVADGPNWNEGFVYGQDRRTYSGTWGNSNTSSMYHPVAILGTTRDYVPSVALIGASTLSGSGDIQESGHTAYNWGWARRILLPDYGLAHLAMPGETAAHWAAPANIRSRYIVASAATHVLCDVGKNDTFAGNSLATIQANCITIWKSLWARGKKVAIATHQPQTTSTDTWATLANQTATASNNVRVQLNNWFRGGAPVDASDNPVAVGSGTPFKYVDLCLELADQCESARDSGLWKVNGTASWGTSDGTHPNTVLHQAVATALSSQVRTWLDQF